MAKFNANEIDNYAQSGTSSFFSLKNDKDLATVRFMYNTLEDVEGYAVHKVQVGDKERYVNCLREYNEPIDNCPLCAARYKVLTKLFVMLYDEDSGEVKIWDRGRSFYSKLSSLCSRYKPLVGTPFEIERNGKKGDTGTTYETYPLQSDDVTLADLPEIPELLGTLIMDKSYEELQFFLENGYFEEETKSENKTDNRPARPQPQRQATQPAQPQRRVPTANPSSFASRRPREGATDKF